ncbi:EAL domain-containing protein [Kineosporia rhizophila]|nr:EAL domain-containing protein [Kineosporia rhizophila]MCE0535389.1 EAL domain-containing protein [Kineosporia rhizophila]
MRRWIGDAAAVPRPVLWVLGVAAVGQLVLCLRWDGVAEGQIWQGARIVCVAMMLAATLWIVHWRVRRTPGERRVWRVLGLALAVFGVSSLSTLILGLVPDLAHLAAVPSAVGTFIAFPLAFRAVVRWSRRSAGVDPDDLLNGFSSVFVAAAAIGCVLAWAHPADGQTLLLTTLSWGQQLTAAQSAVWVILVFSALTAASVSRLYRDVRIWLVTGAYALAGSSSAAAWFSDGARPGWTVAVWCVGLLLVSAAALRPVRFVPVAASDPVKSTVGAFVIVSAGVAVLVTALLTGVPAIVSLFAAAAVMGSSVRLLVNLHELLQLEASRAQALTDELTGTANRRALLAHLNSTLAHGTTTQLIVFDLDHFKEVNDGLGHGAGDDLLRMVTQRLQDKLPEGAVLGRLGGDEFAVVTTGAATGATLPALDEVFAEPFQLTQMSVHIDLSIGLAYWQPDAQAGIGLDAATLMRQADTAMYDAKRNDLRAVTYDPERHADPQGLLSMVGELRRAISTGQLVVHYQPQLHAGRPVAGRAGQLAGVEALVRWQHPRLGLLLPADFLPLAESHGLMDAITHQVLAQAVAQQAQWRATGRDIRVSVNLSAGTLLDASLPRTVDQLLAQHRVPATSLVLEVTETALLREPDRSLLVVEALRAMGAQVSIDDFGTGYSSLTQLRQLPVSELKLDRSFTVDLLTDPRAAAIVANTIALAHDLRLRVVAEGVEDEPTLAALSDLTCDETQGYLHTQPLSAQAFDGWLQRHESGAGLTSSSQVAV